MLLSSAVLAASLAFFERSLTLTNAELEAWLKALAERSPEFVRVSEIGRTDCGTPIRLVTVTEFSSGTDKPGIYVQGHIHSKEMSGTTAACHMMERLAEDHRSGGLLSKMVFYFVPRCNPDGAERMARCPANERSGWGEPGTDEGLIEPRDLDGDGEITNMRRENPDGVFVRSPRDSRCLVRRSTCPDAPGPYYDLFEEGVFVHWKGRPTSLPWGRFYWRRCLDFNRNWPVGWNAAILGAGRAPLDAPETRLQDEFLRSHTNIVSAVSLHNGYGCVFVNAVSEQDRVRYRSLAERGGALMGFPVIESPGERGSFEEYCYGRLGILCYCVELGTRETSCGLDARELSVRHDTYTAPYEVLAQQDAHPEFRPAYLPWRRFSHPQLGAVEIGGLSPTVFGNPLPKDLMKTSERAYLFLIDQAMDALAHGKSAKTSCKTEVPCPIGRDPAPVVVAIPPTFAVRDLCVTADGEIRHYGWKVIDGRQRRVFVASRDGANWVTRLAAEGDVGAMVKSPYGGDWLYWRSDKDGFLELVRSKTGPGDTAPETQRYPWKRQELRQLLPLRTRQRWVAVLSDVRCENNDCYHAAVMLSDDDGMTWRRKEIPPVCGVAPMAEGDRRPHWFNDGCEPTVTELKDGTLLMAVRTSGPHAAFYRSSDGGETWSEGTPDPTFWQANTMPYFFRLKDGRLLFIWNNTQMLPTREAAEYPELDAATLEGKWESVFTNRDALHAAISEDDGRTWRGFREIILNPIRNAGDFRQLGNLPFEEHDKSVHQTQALELPDGKVLLALGQNIASRRLVVFDPQWLYETSREEDFRRGLGNLSTHLYVKSLTGGWQGFAGHCAWNRAPGAMLVRDPDTKRGTQREVLQLCRIVDPRLVSDRQGIVWNFPAARKGRFETECRIDGEGFRLALTDHWVNPCDETNPRRSPVVFELTGELLATGVWHKVACIWDSETKCAILEVDGKQVQMRPMVSVPSFGLSYVHLQTLAEGTDGRGAYFRFFRQTSVGR